MSIIKEFMQYILAIFFILAGAYHFINPRFYLRIMPLYIPWPLHLQYLAGFLEIILGILLLIPQFTNFAAWGLILLLVVIFPANIHMAVNHHLFPRLPIWYHWIRLPLQIVLIAWAWWYT